MKITVLQRRKVPKSIWGFSFCFFTPVERVQVPLGWIPDEYYNEGMSEDELSAAFQILVETNPGPMGNLLKQANEAGIPLLQYITETGPEIRDIFDRMLRAEIYHNAKERGLIK